MYLRCLEWPYQYHPVPFLARYPSTPSNPPLQPASYSVFLVVTLVVHYPREVPKVVSWWLAGCWQFASDLDSSHILLVLVAACLLCLLACLLACLLVLSPPPFFPFPLSSSLPQLFQNLPPPLSHLSICQTKPEISSSGTLFLIALSRCPSPELSAPLHPAAHEMTRPLFPLRQRASLLDCPIGRPAYLGTKLAKLTQLLIHAYIPYTVHPPRKLLALANTPKGLLPPLAATKKIQTARLARTLRQHHHHNSHSHLSFLARLPPELDQETKPQKCLIWLMRLPPSTAPLPPRRTVWYVLPIFFFPSLSSHLGLLLPLSSPGIPQLTQETVFACDAHLTAWPPIANTWPLDATGPAKPNANGMYYRKDTFVAFFAACD